MNNRNWEALIKLGVIVLVAISMAIKQFLQRDLTAPKPGSSPVRPPVPRPERMGGQPMTTAPARPAAPRPAATAPPRLGPNQDMVILSSENRPERPLPTTRKEPQRKPRQADRAGNSSAGKRGSAKSPDRARSDSLAGVTQHLARPVYIGPAGELPPAYDVPARDAAPKRPRTVPLAANNAANLRSALLDPTRIREAILVNEILGPPKALRRS